MSDQELLSEIVRLRKDAAASMSYKVAAYLASAERVLKSEILKKNNAKMRSRNFTEEEWKAHKREYMRLRRKHLLCNTYVAQRLGGRVSDFTKEQLNNYRMVLLLKQNIKQEQHGIKKGS